MSTSAETKPAVLYLTTYAREYVAPDDSPVNAARPRSTKGAYSTAYKLGDPIGDSEYAKEFGDKDFSACKNKEQQHEFTRNNPHPSQKFMVWRFPRHAPKPELPTFPNELTFEAMEKLCRGRLCRSTYRVDYSGVPKGMEFSTSKLLGIPEDPRGNNKYSLESSMRYSYQMPDRPAELQSNISRYGCNKTKTSAAVGVVPAISEPHQHLKPETTYVREFADPVENLCETGDMVTETKKSDLASRTSSPMYKGTNYKPTWLSSWKGPI